MNVDKSFLGTGWSFPPRFGNQPERGEVVMVGGEQDIHESLFVILSTTPGERIMQPAFGCGLKSFVFDELNESTVTEIRDAVDRAILFFESRITVNSIDVDLNKEQEGRLDICVNYTIRGTNTRSNMVYPFYFLEASNVPNK